MWIYTGESGVEVAQGDVVSVVGTTTEYYGLTEVMADEGSVTVSGSGADVAVVALDAIPADWENYESVVVSLSEVTFTGELDSGDEPMTNWGIAIEDSFMDLELGTSYDSVTGVLTYNWDTYKIAPRSITDLAD